MTAGRKALLVAAGIGSRLRPLTDVVPKCLIPINGRPLLGLWLEMLQEAGFDEVVVNLHHHADLVREYVWRSPYARLVTLVHEPELLGTGGTLLANKDRLARGPNLFAHPDNPHRFAPLQFLAAHAARPPEAALTMMTFRTDTPSDCGIVERDQRGMVVGFYEKLSNPPGDIANAAVYVLEPEVFAALQSLGKHHIDFSTEVLPRYLGRIYTVHNELYHRDIGTLAQLARAEAEYPTADPGGAASASMHDPWYGLMSENEARLAHDYQRAAQSARKPLP